MAIILSKTCSRLTEKHAWNIGNKEVTWAMQSEAVCICGEALGRFNKPCEEFFEDDLPLVKVNCDCDSDSCNADGGAITCLSVSRYSGASRLADRAS